MHVSIAITSLMYISFQSFNIRVVDAILVFALTSSLVAYNYIRYYDIVRFKFIKSLLPIYCITIICFFIGLWFFFLLNISQMFLVVILGLITIFYVFPYYKSSIKRKNIRNVAGLKVFVVSIVWALFIVIMPLLTYKINYSLFEIVFFIQIYCFVFISILPFEIRDLQIDNPKLNTIPQVLGIKKTKIIGLILSLIFVVLESYKSIIIESINYNNFTIVLTLSFFLLKSKNEQSKYYSSFWVESLPIIWALSIYII